MAAGLAPGRRTPGLNRGGLPIPGGPLLGVPLVPYLFTPPRRPVSPPIVLGVRRLGPCTGGLAGP